MKPHHHVSDLKFENDFLTVTIDGETKRYALKEISPILLNAPTAARNIFDISPSGYGIHWPLLDEDISIDGLLGIRHEPHRKKESALSNRLAQ